MNACHSSALKVSGDSSGDLLSRIATPFCKSAISMQELLLHHELRRQAIGRALLWSALPSAVRPGSASSISLSVSSDTKRHLAHSPKCRAPSQAAVLLHYDLGAAAPDWSVGAEETGVDPGKPAYAQADYSRCVTRLTWYCTPLCPAVGESKLEITVWLQVRDRWCDRG
jgi:hypothetical protein